MVPSGRGMGIPIKEGRDLKHAVHYKSYITPPCIRIACKYASASISTSRARGLIISCWSLISCAEVIKAWAILSNRRPGGQSAVQFVLEAMERLVSALINGSF